MLALRRVRRAAQAGGGRPSAPRHRPLSPAPPPGRRAPRLPAPPGGPPPPPPPRPPRAGRSRASPPPPPPRAPVPPPRPPPPPRPRPPRSEGSSPRRGNSAGVPSPDLGSSSTGFGGISSIRGLKLGSTSTTPILGMSGGVTRGPRDPRRNRAPRAGTDPTGEAPGRIDGGADESGMGGSSASSASGTVSRTLTV